jgi:hypothetical protein
MSEVDQRRDANDNFHKTFAGGRGWVTCGVAGRDDIDAILRCVMFIHGHGRTEPVGSL